MTSTIAVEPADLTAAAASVRRALDVAAAIARDGTLGPVASGSAVFDDALDRFLTAWRHGMHTICEQADTLAIVLDAAAALYADVDQQVASWAPGPGT